MKNSIIIILCTVCLAFPSILNAQTTTFKIEGKVIGVDIQEVENNSINTPLQNVNIVLLQQDSTYVNGSLSDEKGNFKFTDITKGDYLLKFSYIGYETVLVAIKDAIKDTKMGEIELFKKSTQLSEVTVQGNPIIQKIDRMIVYPTKDVLKHSYDPYDVIGSMMIPRLRVNRVSKVLESAEGGTVQIRINGIKASQTELMAIPAKEIIRIEVIDNPGMKYGEGNIGAIVDVVVKRRTTGGLVNLGGETCPYRLFAGYNFATKLNYKKSQWGLYYDNTLRDLTKIKRDADEVFNLGENNVIHRIQEGTDGRRKYDFHNVRLTYNYSNPNSYMLNITFQNNIRNSPKNDMLSKLYAPENDNYTFAEKKAETWSYTPSLDILFEKKLKHEQKLQFNVIGTSIKDLSNSLYREYNNKHKDLVHIQSDAKSNKYSIWDEALYDKTFKNIVLSTGIRHYQMYAKTQYKGTNPITSSMHQMNSSAFFDLQGKVKSFGYLVSLSGMRSHFKEGDKGHTHYLFTPSVRINFVPHKDGWMQYSFNSGSTIPSLGSLTNVEQQVDSIQVQRGNPYLKTYRTYTNSLMYTYNKPKFASVLQLNHSYYDDPVMEEYFAENNKLIRTENNQQYFQTFAVNTRWMLRNIRLWGLTLGTNFDINFKRFWSKGNIYNHAYSQLYFCAQLEVTYKEFMLFSSYWTNNASLWGETITKGENRVDFGIIYTRKRLQALVGIMYPFVNNYKVGTERISPVAPLKQHVYSKIMGNLVMVSIRYNFEFGKKFKDQNKKARYKDVDSGILKGY